MSNPEFLPTFEFAFEARVKVDPGVVIGRGADERPWLFPITGGTVTGPMLTGEVLPYGGDWATERSKVFQLDARYLIKAQDGAIIEIHNRGFYRASAEVEQRLMAGELVPESDYYYRTAAFCQTDAPAHAWLAESILIGLARSDQGDVCIRFFLLR